MSFIRTEELKKDYDFRLSVLRSNLFRNGLYLFRLSRLTGISSNCLARLLSSKCTMPYDIYLYLDDIARSWSKFEGSFEVFLKLYRYDAGR